MPSFLLRHIDAALMERVKARAEAEGVTVKAAILRFLADYADFGEHMAATPTIESFWADLAAKGYRYEVSNGYPKMRNAAGAYHLVPKDERFIAERCSRAAQSPASTVSL